MDIHSSEGVSCTEYWIHNGNTLLNQQSPAGAKNSLPYVTNSNAAHMAKWAFKKGGWRTKNRGCFINLSRGLGNLNWGLEIAAAEGSKPRDIWEIKSIAFNNK